jgi:hypothetical protein
MGKCASFIGTLRYGASRVIGSPTPAYLSDLLFFWKKNRYLWTYYGYLLGESTIWAPNIFAFVLGTGYTAIFYKNCPDSADWLPGTKNMHMVSILSCSTTWLVTQSKVLAMHSGGHTSGPCLLLGIVLSDIWTRQCNQSAVLS